MRVKILNLDGIPDSSGEIIDPAGVEFEPEVAVEYEFSGELRDQMGFAKIEKTEDGLYATIELNKHWKQDESVVVLLSPCIGGVVVDRKDNTLLKCKINRIGICRGPNTDHRIKSIAEQLATSK